MNEAWVFEHSEECPVAREFAWRFWTTVSNWQFDSDVESVELDGPFAAGSRGVTVSRSSGRIEWRVAAVDPENEGTLEIAAPGAVVRFRWTFEDLGGRTRITQRASLSGEQALPLVNAVAGGLEKGIPAGMQKFCELMGRAAGTTGAIR